MLKFTTEKFSDLVRISKHIPIQKLGDNLFSEAIKELLLYVQLPLCLLFSSTIGMGQWDKLCYACTGPTFRIIIMLLETDFF